MRSINAGAIADWHLFGHAVRFLAFDGLVNKCALRMKAAGDVAVYVSDDETGDTPVLVAYGSGEMEIRFTAIGTASVAVVAPEGVTVFYQRLYRTQEAKKTAAEKLTSVRPMVTRDPNLDRLIMMQRLQQQRHDADLQSLRDELRQREEQRAAELAAAEAAETVVEPEGEETTE